VISGTLPIFFGENLGHFCFFSVNSTKISVFGHQSPVFKTLLIWGKRKTVLAITIHFVW
jgi:hypothetical protein